MSYSVLLCLLHTLPVPLLCVGTLVDLDASKRLRKVCEWVLV